MSITHYLSILFSRQRWRYALLAALVLHLLLGAYALLKDVTLGLDLSLLINSVQFALVQAALTLLYTSTNKHEGQRYSLDTRDYLKRYHKERGRFLALHRDTANGEPRAIIGPPADALSSAGLERLPSRHDLMISHSVLEWTPIAQNSAPMRISEVTFELMDEWYELPWIVAEHGLDTILKRFNAVDRYDYNGLTLATRRWQANPNGFALTFEKSFYYNYLATNLVPEFCLPGGLSYRELLEPGPRLSDLNNALPENHLGLSCLLRTSDGALIIPRRSQHTSVFKGQLSPSISGAANISTCRNATGNYTPLAWLTQELIEELPFLAESQEAFPGTLQDALQHTEFLGMTRELRRCGKPELFFFLTLPIDAARVQQLWEHHIRAIGNVAELTALQGIDHNENAGLLVVDEAQLLQRVAPQVIQRKRRWPQRGQADFHTVLPLGADSDILSESLLANLILYRLRQQTIPSQSPG